MRRSHIITIWGSNTGVGKTLVSAGLMSAVGRRSTLLRALYLKPVQTGLETDAFDGGSDGQLIAAVVGGSHSLDKHAAMADRQFLSAWTAPVGKNTGSGRDPLICRTLYAWRAPLSPHLAAEKEGRGVSDADVVSKVRREIQSYEMRTSIAPSLTIVETAGGVMSPTPDGGVQCEELRFGGGALLVGDGQLGGISSTLCAAEALDARGHATVGTAIFDHGFGNADALRRQRPSELVHSLPPPPALPEPAPQDEARRPVNLAKAQRARVQSRVEGLAGWLETTAPHFDELLEAILASDVVARPRYSVDDMLPAPVVPEGI